MTNVINDSCMMYIHVLLPSSDAIVTKLFDPSLSQVVTIRIIQITIGMPLLSFHHYIRYIFASKGLQFFSYIIMLDIYLRFSINYGMLITHLLNGFFCRTIVNICPTSHFFLFEGRALGRVSTSY